MKFLLIRLLSSLQYFFAVVRNIIGKGTITLDSCNLDIVALKPARPPPLMLSNNIDSKKLLFTELGLDVDASKLRRFAEAAGKASVVDVSFCTKPGVALIQYANVPGGLNSVHSRHFFVYLMTYKYIK